VDLNHIHIDDPCGANRNYIDVAADMQHSSSTSQGDTVSRKKKCSKNKCRRKKCRKFQDVVMK